MPDLEGLSMRSALRMLDGCDCDIAAAGSGYVADQQPAAGTRLAAATPVRLQLLPELQP
jgi:beta-lactam-binding protein with PASTA domain